MPPFWHKRLQFSDPSVELKAAQSVPRDGQDYYKIITTIILIMSMTVFQIKIRLGMPANHLDGGFSYLCDISAVVIFDICRPTSCSTIE